MGWKKQKGNPILIILRAFLHPLAHTFFLGVGGGLIISRAVGERALERLDKRAVVGLERDDESCMLKECEVISELEVSSGGLVIVAAYIRATERQQWLDMILITHVRVRKDNVIRVGNHIAAARSEPDGKKRSDEDERKRKTKKHTNDEIWNSYLQIYARDSHSAACGQEETSEFHAYSCPNAWSCSRCVIHFRDWICLRTQAT